MAQSINARNAMIDARNALLNNGTVEIRTGAAAAVDSAATGSVLAIFNLSATAFAAASNGSSSVNLPAQVTSSAANSGGVVHFVAKSSVSAVVANGSAGVGSGDMQLNTLTWSSGDPVSITGWTVGHPA